MKKGLLAVVTILACALVGAGIATAAEISTSGTIEFKISGTSEEGEPSGAFANGDVNVIYGVTITSGAFEAYIAPEADLTGTVTDAEDNSTNVLTYDDVYISYKGEMATLTMYPFGVDYGLYDLYAAVPDEAPNIPSEPGIKVEVPFEPLTLTAVVNTQEETETVNSTTEFVWTDEDEDEEFELEELAPAEVEEGTGKVMFNYGVGLDYATESLTFGIMANSTSVETADWYGTSYGVKISYEMAPMTFTVEYGTFSPAAEGKEAGSGYYAELSYVTDETGTFKLSYTGADAKFNGAGTPTEDAYSKIYGEWVYPVTENTDLTLSAWSEDTGDGTGAATSYEATTETTLAENVTLTLDITGGGEPSVTTYEAKIGVSF